MKNINFRDLAVGQEFTFDTQQYIKIAPEKVNCCKSYNAVSKDNPNKKIIMNPSTSVGVVDDQLQ